MRDARAKLARASSALSVLLVATALVLAAAEGVARLAFERPQPPYVRYPLAGPMWSPGFTQERLSIDDPPERFVLEVNPLGFRGKAMTTRAKPPSTYRIFFVGASTTENAYLPEERTFPGRVQTALDERLHGSPRVEVANAGIAGQPAPFVWKAFVHRVLPCAPDLVVLLEGHNDLSPALADTWDPDGAEDPEPPPRFRDWLVSWSRLVAVLDDRSLRRSNEKDKRPWYAAKRREHATLEKSGRGSVDPRRGIPELRRWLGRFAALCAEEKVRLALLTQPSLYKKEMKPEEEAALWMGRMGSRNYDTETLREAMEAYNEAVREVARERGLILVDAARAVPQDLAHLSDDVHLTSKGNEVVARAVVEAVLREGTLPR